MSWLYVPGTEVSDSGSDSQEWSIEPYVTLSGTPTQRPSSWRGWKIRPWIRLLSGMTLSRSEADLGVEQWISSLPASPASHGRLRGRSEELTITDGSGPTLFGSSMRFDRGSYSWRTSQDSTGQQTEADSRRSSRILPTSGSMRNGVCSPRPPLEPRNAENDSGFSLWPTATSTDFKQSGGKFAGDPSDTNTHGMTLTDRAVRLWGTPVARDDQKSPEAHLEMKARMGGGRKEPTSLTVQAKMWQTPTTSESEGNGARSGERAGEPKLQGQARMWENPKARDYKNSEGQDERTTPDLPFQATHWPTPRASDGTMGSPGNHGEGGPSLKALAFRLDQTMLGDGNGGSPQADLNPAFVESLMGLPAGWSNLPGSETSSIYSATDSFRRWLRKHSLNYRGGS